jgi:hypothetical protein
MAADAQGSPRIRVGPPSAPAFAVAPAATRGRHRQGMRLLHTQFTAPVSQSPRVTSLQSNAGIAMLYPKPIRWPLN